MTQSKNSTLIAVTGGIGSGKSAVIQFLKNKGYPVISCDEITKDVYKLKSVKKSLKTHFPTAVKGKIFTKLDKKEIAKIAFSDPEKYAVLKETVTDRIFERVLKLAKKMDGLIFVEVPLLFEGNYQGYFDKVIVVLRDKTARLNAVKERSNLSTEEVLLRMDIQIDYDTQDFTSYRVIKNNGNLDELKTATISLISAIRKEIR